MPREEFTEEIIILKVGLFREADCWLRLFSPSKGVFTAFAFGGYKSRRRFPGCLDALNHVLFKIITDRAGRYYSVSEGSLLHRFSGIHRNPQRLGMAVNCVKFLEAAQIGSPSAASVFGLFYQILNILDAGQEVSANLPLFFRARLACEYGYRPELLHCGNCGAILPDDQQAYFSLQHGQAFCSACRIKAHDGVHLNKSVLQDLHWILRAEPRSWQEIRSGVELTQPSLLLLDRFVQRHMGLIWVDGRFRQI